MQRFRAFLRDASHGPAPAAPNVRRRGCAGGFTLIELMITVAIIAILATIAYPAYQEHIRKSRRAEAQSFLMAAAARQQQFLLDTRAYAASISGVGVPVPTHVSANYTLTLTVAAGPPPTYLLTASPIAGQAHETCGTLTIDQAGAKTASRGGCW